MVLIYLLKMSGFTDLFFVRMNEIIDHVINWYRNTAPVDYEEEWGQFVVIDEENFDFLTKW